MADELTTALANAIARLPRGGEVRDGQVQMAIDVAAAIEQRHHLVVQAGTGTGKSLAYLVPAILSGKKVVVSTATKALQDQLAGTDLPFLQAAMPDPFTFAVLKGRSNYLCVQRTREVSGGDGQLTIDEVETTGNLGREIMRLVEWGRTAKSGDRADAPFEPSPRAWQAVSVSGMECPGANKCPAGDECFAERARGAAEVADVVVVNTHLYGAHIASGGHVLPEHDVVVFDEAHELEDIVAAALGVEVSAGRFSALVRLSRRHVGSADATALDNVFRAGDALERTLAAWVNQRLPGSGPEEITEALTQGATSVQSLLRAIKSSPDDPARTRAQQAGGHLQGDLDLLRDPGPTRVRWVEGPVHTPVLKLASVDVAGALAEKVWPDVTSICTSATIPVGLPLRIGLPPDKHETRDVGSPFDFANQALLYCATHMPEPRAEGYEQALHDELAFLIDAAGGRTLALFTSWKRMQAAAEEVARRVSVPILAQGELPKPKLVERFAAEEAACLFATMGFWQGIDVPGRTLSVVSIDRLPFPRPDEPLQQARRERAGPAAFRLIDLPRAATMLAQGAGRLIRNTEDRGVVAVLDSRLATANYRWELINALPPMRRTKDRDEVAAFLGLTTSGSPPASPAAP